jgi:hypothetical protein
VIEHLPSKCKALSSNSSTTKKKLGYVFKRKKLLVKLEEGTRAVLFFEGRERFIIWLHTWCGKRQSKHSVHF